jgi:REP element-mobilizing transposase RayT
MAQSLARILIHLIFSTKNRTPILSPEICAELYPYMHKVLTEHDSPPLQIGGVRDHVHILLALSRTNTMAKAVEVLKVHSTKWLKTKGQAFNGFHWQGGYGAFSVSQSNVSAVIEYIQRQEEHHRVMTFQEEYRRFLELYQVPYDERYVWD